LCSLHRPNDWPDWLKAARVPHIDGNGGLKFENSALAYQAAIDELGIVMAQYAFVADDLRSGRLVAPLTLRAETRQSYFLLYPEHRKGSPKIQSFENWLASLDTGAAG
jgi:LysR family glycine cleavage system transcriptional activator